MTLSTSAKLLAGGALVVTGGGIVAAVGAASFVSGMVFMDWLEKQNRPKGYIPYRPGTAPKRTPDVGATGPITEPPETAP